MTDVRRQPRHVMTMADPILASSCVPWEQNHLWDSEIDNVR